MLIIPGDMPDKCKNCPLEDHEYFICILTNRTTYDVEKERYFRGEKMTRPDWCPIIKEYNPEKGINKK